MPACGCYLQGALRLLLPPNLGEIHLIVGLGIQQRVHIDASGLLAVRVVKVGHHLQQVLHPNHFHLAHHRRLQRVCGRHHEPPLARFARMECDRQHAIHGTHAAIQRQLAHNQRLLQPIQWDLLRDRQNAHRNRQVVGGSLFAHIGRREIDGQFAQREVEPHIADGGAHALTRFLHRCIGQSHQRPLRHARLHIHLHLHGEGVDAVQRRAIHLRQHPPCVSIR
jgi:hypothetical protein